MINPEDARAICEASNPRIVSSLADLKRLFKLCRAQGIDELKFDGLEVKFGTLPEKAQQDAANYEEEHGEPTEEDLMFWSSDAGQSELDKKVGLR